MVGTGPRKTLLIRFGPFSSLISVGVYDGVEIGVKVGVGISDFSIIDWIRCFSILSTFFKSKFFLDLFVSKSGWSLHFLENAGWSLGQFPHRAGDPFPRVAMHAV